MIATGLSIGAIPLTTNELELVLFVVRFGIADGTISVMLGVCGVSATAKLEPANKRIMINDTTKISLTFIFVFNLSTSQFNLLSNCYPTNRMASSALNYTLEIFFVAISNLKIVALFAAAFLLLSVFFFIPAGTLDYWQAWAYLAIIFIPAAFVIGYFAKTDPAFLERRFQYREKEAAQKKVIAFGWLIFVVGFFLPGFDHRLGWSNVHAELSIAADVFVFLGYIFVFLVFKENSFAGRTIRVEKNQTVISSGPYALIRHPMYLGTLVLYLATPIALGSYWAIIPFLFVVPMLFYRIKNEEEVLRRDLPGYTAYCEKVKYRLVPGIW